MSEQQLNLYLTVENDCGYFAERKARNIIPDPQIAMSNDLYGQLIQHGYRRSGEQTYTPHCDECDDCIACRLPTTSFKTTKSQRRCLKNNQDLTCTEKNAHYSDEYFELYAKYLNSRHDDGEMANPEKSEFSDFLYSNWSKTVFYEIRKDEKLIAVAVTDITTTGLSAVYTFFDPEESKRSLGTYCILKQVEKTQASSMEYLYMGYWIDNCRKMQYKTNFKPMQLFRNNQWQLQKI